MFDDFNDPLVATFRSSKTQALDRWYPFPEGYSRSFVRQVLGEFALTARRVLDPFCGVGTTVLAAAEAGLDSFFCEVNPLLQFLTETRIKALTLESRTRRRVVLGLRETEDCLEKLLNRQAADLELGYAYRRAFGDSRFFDEKTFVDVLKARSLVDAIACADPLLADFVAISIAPALVPSSLLKRAGDLRYRTAAELRSGPEPFLIVARRRLRMVSEDLLVAPQVVSRPLLVNEDARGLELLPPLDVEAVVTSPPYLNGTNYFRNTKIELWFLRCIRDSADLQRFRAKAITAGINDVNGHKSLSVHPDVEKIVRKIEARAYDPRIPRMVGAYFHDLEKVIFGLQKHLVPGALLCVDIGDSAYGGVRVPTDGLLKAILLDFGFHLEFEKILRQRLSRGGLVLGQVMLCFRRGNRLKAHFAAVGTPPEWRTFKAKLPHQVGSYAKRNSGHPLHSLCSYQGKMKPSLAHHLVNALVPPGGRLLDLFAGVGTIPFEGCLLGCTSFGFEISAAARVIASAKVARPRSDKVLQLLRQLEICLSAEAPSRREMEAAAKINFNGSVPEYYNPRTLREILLARRFFLGRPLDSPEECLVLACFLHILHGNRPYALSRRSHSITPFRPTGPSEYRPVLPRLRDKVLRSLAAQYPDSFRTGKIFYQDATSWWPAEVDQLDVILTSPPFFDSTRFYLANWLRLWFCGWEREDFDSKPLYFLDFRQKVDFAVYEPVFRQARERLKPNGMMALHLGKSSKCDMADALAKVAKPWFRVLDRFSESVRHCESHGIRDKGAVKEHQYLILGF